MSRLKNHLEPIIHFLVWMSFFIVEWSQTITLGPFRKQDGSIYAPLAWSFALSIVLFYVNALYLIPKFFALQRYKYYFVLVVILYTCILVANTVLDHFYVLSLFSSEKEPLTAELSINASSKMFILSLSLGYGLSKNWMLSLKRQQQLVSEKLTTELKYLKAQINPHFLFNTLNMAYASALKSNDEATADIIEKISGFMRYVLYESNEDSVPLDKELRYIDNYINLQTQRLSPEIAEQVRYQITGIPDNLKIAPMILIPFIENVFKHGVMLTKKPKMSILLDIKQDSLVLETSNIKNKIKVHDTHSGIGMSNVKGRLQLLYPNRYQLDITDSENSYKAKLEIQLNNPEYEVYSDR